MKNRMQAEEGGTWKLDVRAKKANSFHLSIKATAARRFFQLSLRLNLKLPPAVKSRPKFFKSKFLKKVLEKFRFRLANKRPSIASSRITPLRRSALTIKGWDWGSSSAALLENLALFWKWIFEKHQNVGRPITIFLYLASLFKNMGSRKLSILLLLLVVAIFSPSILQYPMMKGLDIITAHLPSSG